MTNPTPDDAARKERRREYQRQYRAANAERLKQQKREWYLANRERLHAEFNQRYASDPAFRQEVLQRNSAYQDENSESVRAHRVVRRENGDDRAYQLQRVHGLDDAGWARMWTAQEGCCYLCGSELDPSRRKTHVEHYHGCRAGHPAKKSCAYCQRGLACSRCNTMIAQAGDDPEFLRMIADKLEAANRDVAHRQEKAPQQLTLLAGRLKGVVAMASETLQF